MIYDSLFLENELRSTHLKILQEQRAPLTIQGLLPIEQEPDELTESVGSILEKNYGVAAFVDSAFNPNDVPNVSLSRSDEYKPVRNMVAGAEWTNDELSRAQRLGIAINTRKGEIAILALDELENTTLLDGYTAGGISGLFTSGLISTTALTTGVWDNGATTADQIFADFTLMINYIITATSTARQEAVSIVLPFAAYARAETTFMSVNKDQSVLNAVKAMFGSRLAGISFAREFDAKKEALAYIRNPEYMHHRLVMATQALPILPLGYGYKAAWRRRTAGVLVQNSTTQRRFTGILT